MKLTLTLESFYAKLRHNLYENNIEVWTIKLCEIVHEVTIDFQVILWEIV